MQGYSFEEVILQGKRTKKYRLAVRFEDPQYGPLALFLNSEAGVFGAEIAEALEQAQAAMGQTEFTGRRKDGRRKDGRGRRGGRKVGRKGAEGLRAADGGIRGASCRVA